MNLSPTERQQAVTEAARILADEAKAAAGGILNLMVLPMSVASQMLAMTPTRIKALMPYVQTMDGKHGVTLAEVQRRIVEKTVTPKGVVQ